MKVSQFNVLVVPPENPDWAILYNTLHDHRLLLENNHGALKKFFQKIKHHESLNSAEEELTHLFHQMGILLDDDVNEQALFDGWYENKIQNGSGGLNLIVVVTMACNLRCPYCYEKDQLNNSRHMSEESAQNLVLWVKKEMSYKSIQTLEMTYFGGEPLMNQKVLFWLSTQLKELCEKKNIVYNAGIVTNGVLMTPKVQKQMKQAGLIWAKVTLDGNQETHDTTRINARGRGSFDQIIKNLEALNQNLSPNEKALTIHIGGNFSDQTYQGFIHLLDYLKEAPFKKYIGRINLKPVQNISSSASPQNKSNNPCEKVCFDKKNIKRIVFLREELLKRDLPSVDGLNMGPCDFYRGDSYTIGLDGTLYPCIAFVDNHSCAIGHVIQDTKKNYDTVQDAWRRAKPWTTDCYRCSFLPVCTGGCRATAYSNGYSWNSTVCEKKYFSRVAHSLAKEMLFQETLTEITDSGNDLLSNNSPSQVSQALFSESNSFEV